MKLDFSRENLKLLRQALHFPGGRYAKAGIPDADN
jgi:hypothetical protein